MITIITAILNFLFLTWVFWPLAILSPIIAFGMVANLTDKADRYGCFKHEVWSPVPGFFIAFFVAALAWHFPFLRGYFDGWRAIATVLGGYVIVGFFMSFYKWIVVLVEFYKERENIIARITEVKKSALSSTHHSCEEMIESEYKFCNVEKREDDTYIVYPNWKKYPIEIWWCYWPFFIVQIPFDIVKDFIERAFNWIKGFYNSIAKKFSINA